MSYIIPWFGTSLMTVLTVSAAISCTQATTYCKPIYFSILNMHDCMVNCILLFAFSFVFPWCHYQCSPGVNSHVWDPTQSHGQVSTIWDWLQILELQNNYNSYSPCRSIGRAVSSKISDKKGLYFCNASVTLIHSGTKSTIHSLNWFSQNFGSIWNYCHW